MSYQVFQAMKKSVQVHEKLREYMKQPEVDGMTKRLKKGEYGITKRGMIIVRYHGGAWGGNNHYEALPPIGYSWEGCSSGGVHGWNEPTLALARDYEEDLKYPLSCIETWAFDYIGENGIPIDQVDEVILKMRNGTIKIDDNCIWGDMILEPWNHHPIDFMDDKWSTFGMYNPFFS